MKQQELPYFLGKIILLSCLMLAGIQSYGYFFGSENTTSSLTTQEENDALYHSAYISNYATTGVALSTRIGISFGENSLYKDGGTSFYKQVSFLGANTQEKRAIRKDMISTNMILIREYLNLSKNDIISLLKTSNDRKTTLEGYISQLGFRYNNASSSIASLELQKAELVGYLDEISTKIEATKAEMEKNFGANLVDNTLGDVDTYFSLRQEYTETFTDIVFINQFLAQYNFLNSYNANMLDTLMTNKQAIINQTYVVIPDTGGDLLRPLDLIFDEADIIEKTSE